MLHHAPCLQSGIGRPLLKFGAALVIFSALSACGSSKDSITSDESRQATVKTLDEGRQKLMSVASDKALWSEGLAVGAQTLDQLAKDKAFSGMITDAKSSTDTLFSRAPKLVVSVVSPLEMGSYQDDRALLDVRPDKGQIRGQPRQTPSLSEKSNPSPAQSQALSPMPKMPGPSKSLVRRMISDSGTSLPPSEPAEFLVQLGSFSTQSKAWRAWQSLSTQSPGLMAYAPHFETIMTSKGPLVRLRLAIKTPAKAEAICHSLKLSDTWCTHPRA